ncbi:1549_t:CDS:2, partial [Gigaspora rosea]
TLEKMAERYNAAKAKSIPVESIKYRKTGNKENQDPQVIPACKVRAIGKKKHNLSKNLHSS